ncbi:LacI family DNA-binding transcriptional regulator [Chloroflexota bacterium]|nr:LacI family DNA-binding transcriptional regulator [Chloroflexota bacterium]
MAITLEEIAKLSNVSRATVSRVINGESNVREETRQRVLDVIESVNFQPNLAARSLAAGRTNVIGLVIPAGIAAIFSDPWFPQVVNGISMACNSKGYSVMLWLAEPEYERQMITRILHSGLLDGVIVSSMSINDPIIKALHLSKMPFVLIGRHPTLDIVHVDVDNYTGGYDATKHLISLGNKKIATISGPQNLIAGYDRFQGYKQALEDNGLSVDSELVIEGDFSEVSGYEGGLELIKHHPDAIFVSNDTMALGTLRAMREMKINVPDDIAIVGFDDIPNAISSPIPLTTVRQPSQKMGRAAVNALLDLINNKSNHQNKIFSTELIIRESCGATK